MQCLDLHGTTNYSEFLPSISDCKDVSFNAQFRRYHIYNPRYNSKLFHLVFSCAKYNAATANKLNSLF